MTSVAHSDPEQTKPRRKRVGSKDLTDSPAARAIFEKAVGDRSKRDEPQEDGE